MGCSLVTAAVLESRGGTEKDRDHFLGLDPVPEKSLIDCVDLGSGAPEAAERWKRLPALGKVLVYGDYDVDGVSSTTLAMEICREKARLVRYFIPHRHDQGYGLHESVLRKLLPMGWDTLFVVDCGSKDTGIISMAENAGLNVFVFDHHQPEEGMPFHSSVVNPHGQGGNAAGKALCATGVLWTWARKYGILPEKRLESMKDLAALATLADCMPTQFNRLLVKDGIGLMRSSPRPGLAKLFQGLD